MAFIVIAVDDELHENSVWPDKYDTEEDARKEVLKVLEETYDECPMLGEYDEDEFDRILDETGDISFNVANELAHYEGTRKTFHFEIGEVND
jgi:hypothetical protein